MQAGLKEPKDKKARANEVSSTLAALEDFRDQQKKSIEDLLNSTDKSFSRRLAEHQEESTLSPPMTTMSQRSTPTSEAP